MFIPSTLFALASADAIPLVTFDGTAATTFTFTELNDPVMGGKSTGTWTVEGTSPDQYGSMDGDVVDVPSLKAPGFIKAAADGTFPDASTAIGGDLVLTVRSKTTSYTGFRVTFAAGTLSPSYACAGGSSIPFSGGCYKAKFMVPPSGATDFVNVRIPFANFSDHWSPATGDQTTTCAQDKSVCPTTKELSGIKRFEIWAEGVSGEVQIDLRAISAMPPAVTELKAASSSPPAEYDSCSAEVQSPLKFGISGRTTPTVPVAVDDNENLASAVCCDLRVAPFAEPQFLYEAPDILLFNKLPSNGTVTTFYDSVCGLPVFKTPVGRTFADFKADTDEHGWPSFRSEEVFTENVITNKTTGYVTSKCGTHLGSYLPDEQGPRWCIDLACIAGNSA